MMVAIITDLQTIIDASNKVKEKERAKNYTNIMNYLITLTNYERNNPNYYKRPSVEDWNSFLNLSD
jgi:hypothetical protein